MDPRILFRCLDVSRKVQEFWDRAIVWFFGLGEQYGVDPIVFGSIYVGAIPLFALSVAWLIKAKRSGKPLTWPTFSAGFWFISSYLYLFIAGENIPWWIYAAVIALLGYAGFASYRNIQSKLKHTENPN